jgi:hypothetical protein
VLQDPAATCSGCKTDTSEVKSPFRGFRFHDLRHQAITELAESKASDQTIMGIASHVSRKMLQHYSHVRLEAKRTALDALSMRPTQLVSSEGKADGYDTKLRKELEEVPQVVDLLVELSGIEPLASSLRTRRSPSWATAPRLDYSSSQRLVVEARRRGTIRPPIAIDIT